MASETETLNGEHARFEALLPWYVAGRIDSADREYCEAHLAVCSACQEELRLERALMATMDQFEEDVPTENLDEAWLEFSKGFETNLSSELPELRRHKLSGVARWRPKAVWRNRSTWLVTAQSVAMIAMAVVLIPVQFQEPVDSYETLSGPGQSERLAADAIVIFKPTVSEFELRQILSNAKARIVDGPMENGGYVLQIRSDDPSLAVENLQALEQVILAQSLKGSAE